LDIVDCRPFLLENVETDVAGHVNVWVVHRRDENNVWGGVWICGRKCERKFEGETGVGLCSQNQVRKGG
jgi:hypothetical protein